MLTINLFPSHLRKYDFQTVVSVATLIYGFASIVPLCIWFTLKQLEAKVKLITVICLYGYSLFHFIPAAVSPHPTLAYPPALINLIFLPISSLLPRVDFKNSSSFVPHSEALLSVPIGLGDSANPRSSSSVLHHISSS